MKMIHLIATVFCLPILCGALRVHADAGSGASSRPDKPEKMIGIYVHQHWCYNHPYAARTWTFEDWRGYADGVRRLGYNTILLWPVIEIMPSPLTPGDEASLQKLTRVIDTLHQEFGMKVYLALCPNVGVKNEVAAKYTFETRPFFQCDTRVNPADPAAMRQLMQRREELLRPLARVDGISIIDSDPGGYAGSNNAEFIQLLDEHRKMFDRLRPGIELIYWMHAGWEAYSRFYSSGRFALGDDAEHEDALRRLKELNPEPWGVANGLAYAQKLGIADRIINFRYGYIEGEPSFPLTQFGAEYVAKGGADSGPRGVMGNAQTHCVQLPNTFAYARGALGKTVTDADFVAFANDLIIGHGREIVDGWKALHGENAEAMRTSAKSLAALADGPLQTGPLKGLLFGDPKRFIEDLVVQLRMKAASEDFCAAVAKGQAIGKNLRQFLEAAQLWISRHDYKNYWYWPKLMDALRKLNSAEMNAVLDQLLIGDTPFEKFPGNTPFERVQNGLKGSETFTPRLIEAMRMAAAKLEK